MSNVFTRFRHPTGLEFWDNAVEIGKLLVRFAMNEKNIPKRYTFLFAHPLIAKYQEMRDAIVEANSVYPTNEHELMMRKDAQQRAICLNEEIIQRLQDTLEILPHIDADKLDELGERLPKESTLLRGWRNSSKIMRT